MKKEKKHRRALKESSLTVIQARVRNRPHYAGWRALTLVAVYVLFAVHILHWKFSGKTLAPLELNEVMYTVELGVITAGFLFMCLLVLGTMIFGRFFCSWGCHIMALQDLCAWILARIGIRRKPVRSRILLFVPPMAALYMFAWPQVLRVWQNRELPEFHWRTDAEGWASFTTTDFWRNLPGPWITVLTFLICGFIIVYLLGSRTFCTYVCPYGAIFALADRAAIGRIRVTQDCTQCATCTATCTSGIRVHEEVARHGQVVNSACMKDFDCVSACPQGALYYGLGAPSLSRAFLKRSRFGNVSYEFSLGEEFWIAAVFVFSLFTFRGLYGAVPFLMSMALAGTIAFLSVYALRLLYRRAVVLSARPLKAGGRITVNGYLFVAFFAVLAVFVAHSAVIRYHEFVGLRKAHAASQLNDPGRRELAAQAYAHLAAADRYGLFPSTRTLRGALDAALYSAHFEEARRYAARLLVRHPQDAPLRLQMARIHFAENNFGKAERELRQIKSAAHSEAVIGAPAHQLLGEILARRGAFHEAEEAFRRSIRLDEKRASAHAALGTVLAELGQFKAGVAELRRALNLDPKLGEANYNLGTILAHLGRDAEAVRYYEEALKLDPDDATVHNNMGLSLLQLADLEGSGHHLQRAIALQPAYADAHFNFSRVLALQGDLRGAHEHLRSAANLDPRYAQFLDDAQTENRP